MRRSRQGRHTERREIERLQAGSREKAQDALVEEVPFTILLNGVEIATLLCYPSDLTFLAAGFLLSEGFIGSETDLTDMVLNERGRYVHVTASGAVRMPEAGSTGRLVTSGCGSSKTRQALGVGEGLPPPVSSDLRIGHEVLTNMMKQFLKGSSLFQETGAVHSCGICDSESILYRADDIGRHNALDKVVGWSFLNGTSLGDKVLLSTGRASSEVVLKAVRAGVPAVVSHSAPTSLGVALAEQLGCTLVGFARGRRMNIYTHGFRIV